jgi:hypothetical protein
VVTPLNVVDLPESYKDALAGVTGTFRASFQPISSRLEAFGKVFQPTTLNGGTTQDHNCANCYVMRTGVSWSNGRPSATSTTLLRLWTNTTKGIISHKETDFSMLPRFSSGR